MKKLKMLLHWLVCTLVTFLCIYLFIFAGGWKLVESGDVILIEIAVSIVIGFVIWIIFELTRFYDSKIENLEKRIEELENKLSESSKNE
ncbi:MAG: hypothetical protein ACI4KI_03860 [Candidatus Fimenecus sp.]